MRIKNASNLLNAAEVLPKPKKLVIRDSKNENELVITGQTTGRRNVNVKPKVDISLLNLPNVKVSDKRITKEDQEKQTGRWKVIEEELAARRLPLSPIGYKYSA
jgi:hypothetical protein